MEDLKTITVRGLNPDKPFEISLEAHKEQSQEEFLQEFVDKINKDFPHVDVNGNKLVKAVLIK